AHEYTKANIAFALSVDPENVDLQTLAEEVRVKRMRGDTTVPSTLSVEMACNPFLRAKDVEEFAKLRKGKDNF
ncbi:MAG: hydroxyacylglutathione hydrolase C-terminal domain-containing protein, partial [Litoreibacter sp.]